MDASDAEGQLPGCWRPELGQLIALHGCAALEDMAAEHRRALLRANPCDAGAVVAALGMESDAPFPSLPPIRTVSPVGRRRRESG
ncbi:hypothetical protein AO398_23090 [Methylobacterium sp. GXS13]|nr:hypothetical protein AO398_23090 [Methylobacterium sp. GXS13]